MAAKVNQKGFTTLEIVFVSSILAVATVGIFPDLFSSGDSAREAEVKSNIHVIQIALERYAVDTGGFYPLILYGGDVTDTFVKLGAPDSADTGFSYYMPPNDPGYQPFPGDLDALIQFGYLVQYPRNPFSNPSRLGIDFKIKTNPAENGFGPLEFHFDTSGQSRVNIWAQPFDRALYYVRRLVGGESGDLMWDVSEGQRHAPWPIVVVPEPEPHWSGFSNPQLSSYAPENIMTARDDYQFWLTPGNFYYYALFEGIAGYSSFVQSGGPNPNTPLTGWVIGYHLCGYGAPLNAGQDVYNLWGDYTERSLFTVNSLSFSDPGNLYVGPDGRRDGVIITIDSGVNLSSQR